jgi:NUMOD3 motif
MAAGWNKGKRKPLSEGHKRKIALALMGNQHALGLVHTEQSKERMSIGHKGQIPWNKIKAWNNGKEWPDTVRKNIFKGMILCWQRRKQQIKTNE